MFKIKILANKDAVSGRSLPPYTVVEDDDNVDDAIDEVNKSLNKSRCNGAKIIILTHGEEDGDFKLSDDYDHMSKVMKPIDGGGKPVIFDLYSCHSGHELEKGSQNRKQYLMDISGDEAFKDDGVLLFVNAGGRVTLVDYNADQISRTHQIMDPVRLFMQKILHSPETVKVVRKADASDGSPDDLAVFKYSTPKPQSAAELSDDKIAAFLNQEVTRFCAFIGENPQQYLGELATQLTPNVIRQYKANAMVHEVVRNRLKYVDHYLQSGVPIDATAIGQTTVMHALSLSEKSPSILADCDYLLAKGANIDAAGTSGRSALMNCFGEDGAGMELAKHLISRGANTTVADIEGSTIFHIAAISGSADSCRIIAATGLDHNVHDKNGFTPVYDAATHNNVDVVRYFVEELKVDPNQKNGVGEPILYGAIIAPGPETMEYLLQNPHIRVDERNSVGETVFHSAARRGNTGAVYALVKSGADPLIPTQSGKTVVEELRSTLNPQEFQELGQAIAQAMADRTSHAHHKRKSTASAASTQAAAAVTPTSAPGAPQLAAQPAVKRVHHTP